MLCAHWDTRPFADRDTQNINLPIGANDGASGVGVLLEIARVIQKDSLKIGLEIILFDVEDYGALNYNSSFSDLQATTILVSRISIWSYNLPKNYQKPNFGILLDMVGAKMQYFQKKKSPECNVGYHLIRFGNLGNI